MVSKTLANILGIPTRTDGVTQSGNMIAGDGNSVPCRPPISRPPTLGSPSAPALIVGDAVSGMPKNNQPVTPDLGPIEKVLDTRTTLPRREGGEP